MIASVVSATVPNRERVRRFSDPSRQRLCHSRSNQKRTGQWGWFGSIFQTHDVLWHRIWSVETGAKIIGGIRAGDRERVGANAVVLCDLPAGALPDGAPARAITAAKSKNIVSEATA